MEVKTRHYEYIDWKTVYQWQKEYKVVIDKSKIKELWITQYCKVSAFYTSPQNVRNMTEEEIIEFDKNEKQKRREQQQQYRINRKKREEEEEALYKRRQEWHTDWQWYDKNRKCIDLDNCKLGKQLNISYKDNSPFAPDYWYFHISNTVEIKSEEEKKELYIELYEMTYGKKPDEKNK